jgi:hypothetical protein
MSSCCKLEMGRHRPQTPIRPTVAFGPEMAQHEPVARIEALYRNEWQGSAGCRHRKCAQQPDGSHRSATVEVRQNKPRRAAVIQIKQR